jgi:hypothetical protein
MRSKSTIGKMARAANVKRIQRTAGKAGSAAEMTLRRPRTTKASLRAIGQTTKMFGKALRRLADR